MLRRVIYIAALYTGLAFILVPRTGVSQNYFDGICGYPYTSQPVTNPVIYQSLRKPTLDSDTTFNIRKNVSEQSNEFINDVPFTRVYSGDELEIYVETDEWNSERVTDQIVEDLRKAMLEETPEGSVYPNQGIFETEVELFGEPPDIDNNGKVFILLIDVRDNYDPEDGGSYIAGYFDPADQQSAYGNHSDILYIDTNPGLQSGNFLHTMMTAAHELQHLLHYAADKDESVWINEGLSEVTAHLFGLPGRNFSHFLDDPTRNLTNFDQSIQDYAKVGLWTLYLYNQYGEDFLNDLTRNPSNGITGLNEVFKNRGLPTFKDNFTNWTIANAGHGYLPVDPVNTKYRYGSFNVASPYPALVISNFPAPEQSGNLKGYSASYIRVIGGQDISAQFFPPLVTSMDATLLLSDDDGFETVRWPDVSNGGYYDFLSYNQYENAWLVLTNAKDMRGTQSYTVTFNGLGGKIVETLDYTEGPPEFYITQNGGTPAVEFDFPSAETELLQASVNLFNNTPVTLELRESKDGALLARNMLSSPNQGWNSWGLDSLDVKLSEASLLVLPIDGTESNGVGYTSDNGSSGNSYFRGANSSHFYPLDSLSVGSDNNKLNGDWSMRMQISYPGTADSTNKGNWKHNPWIVSTEQHGTSITLTVQFEEAGPLRIDVFNILGQKVETVVNTNYPQPNQPYTIQWDARNSAGTRVSSGVYFFAVRYKDKHMTKKITLLW